MDLPLQTLKRRLDPPKTPGPFFCWHDFRKPAFNVFIIAGAINFLGLYTREFHTFYKLHREADVNDQTVLTYIGLSAIAVGVSPGFSFYLVSIANASSGFGRVASGYLGDKIGAVNVSAPLTFVCAIMTYAWPFATTKGSLVAVAIIYGFCSGAYVTLLPAPLVMMGDIRDAGRRTGIAGSAIAFGAVVGPPISGAIIQSHGGYGSVGYYAGNDLLTLSTLDTSLRYSLLLLCFRGVHYRGCHTPIRHEIPDAWHLAWKVLVFCGEDFPSPLQHGHRGVARGLHH